jgi:membrane protein YqaA with SNARE-associated domain
MTILTAIGIALAGNLLSGVVGFVIGRATKHEPKPTGETYVPKNESDLPF